MLSISDETPLKTVRRELFRNLRLMPSRYTIDVKARVNIGGLGPVNYALVVVNSSVWETIARNAVTIYGDMKMVVTYS